MNGSDIIRKKIRKLIIKPETKMNRVNPNIDESYG